LVWGDEIQSSIESVVSLALNKYNISVKAKGLIEDFSTFKFYSSNSEIKKIEFYTDKNKKILNDIDNIRRGFLSTRMIQKSNVSILIDMFASDEGKIDLYGKSLYLNDLNKTIDYIDEFVFDKDEEELPLIKSILNNNANKNLYRYRPYLITMQDISKSLFISEAIKGKTLSEDSYKHLKIKSVSVMIEKLYYSINFFRRFTKSDEKQTRKKSSLVSFKEIDKSYNKSSISSDSKPNYNIIKIGRGDKKKIKVAIATARNYEKNFEGVLLDETNRSLRRYNELSEIIRQTVKGGADILVLPENYIPFEWLGLLERECKKNNMAIITGVEHIKIKDKVYNLIASLFPYEYKEYKFVYTNLRTKVWYSPEEKRQIQGYRKGFVEGNEYNLFIWNNIWIPVYCCFEIASIIDRSSFFSLADLFVSVEWNRDINYFDNIIESLNRDMHCYCVQVNTSNYGDSCLVQPTNSYNHIMLKTKGGLNSCVLIEEIDIDKLRRFQIKEYELQKSDKFKPTPPNFNKDIVYAKIKNNLFDQLN